jgi:hypothetical protein
MTILVAIPYLPSLPHAILDQMHAQVDAMESANEGLDVVLMDGTSTTPPNAPRYTAHAAARNRLLDRYLRPHHTHVLWIDADLVRVPATLPMQLIERSDGGIIAPLVVIEGTQTFYDTHGFIEVSGRAFGATPPYTTQRDEVIDCLSVGCCYLAPAELYLGGVRYHTTSGHTEHWSVCQAALAHGLPVRACRSLKVEHASLPKYGVAWN